VNCPETKERRIDLWLSMNEELACRIIVNAQIAFKEQGRYVNGVTLKGGRIFNCS
jgi:hypothetical protein